MRYRRDVSADDEAAIDAEKVHVRAHLSACVDSDDDPDARGDDVKIEMLAHVDGNPNLVSIIGEIDGEPEAPYLRKDYTPDDDGSDLPSALDREPTDLDADAYAAHMAAKGQR